MGTRRLTERCEFTGMVDRTGAYPIVKGVLLCGPISQHKRRYHREAFSGDRVKQYDGRPVFMNHGKPRESRRYEDKIAVIQNARHRDDGMPIGDLAVNPKHPLAETFLHDVEHHPKSCGMSHVADCDAKRAADGWDDVNEIAHVESVDVVIGPATTNGIFEQGGQQVSTIKLRDLIERVRPKLKEQAAQKGARRWLLASEDDDYGGPDMAVDVAEPEEGGEPEDDLWSGFHTACNGFLEKYKSGEMTADEACKEIQRYVKAHAKLLAGKGPDEGEGDGEEEDEEEEEGDEETPKEAKKPKKGKKSKVEQKPIDPYTCFRECKALGLTDPADYLIVALSHTADPAARKSMIQESLAGAKAGAKPPKSGGTVPPPAKTGNVQATEQRAFSAW